MICIWLLFQYFLCSLTVIISEFDENAEHYQGFFGKSFGQAWHWFKEKKRLNSVALNANLTYVTLPWHRIIAGKMLIWQNTYSCVPSKLFVIWRFNHLIIIVSSKTVEILGRVRRKYNCSYDGFLVGMKPSCDKICICCQAHL